MDNNGMRRIGWGLAWQANKSSEVLIEMVSTIRTKKEMIEIGSNTNFLKVYKYKAIPIFAKAKDLE